MAAVVSPSFLARLASLTRRSGVALAFAAFGVSAPAQTVKTPPPTPQLAFELITKAEARRDRDLRPKNEALDMPEVRPRSLPGPAAAATPIFAIRILAPTPQVVVTAPLRIELAFETPPGARVVPSSFRVLYGVLKIDLTDRLRRFSTISERGVVVDQAVVPDGLHRLFLQVADDRGNVAEQELRLRVGVAS